ncbi:MAG: hypothetical protein AAGJ46_09605 [Planctomycetota bacterium]
MGRCRYSDIALLAAAAVSLGSFGCAGRTGGNNPFLTADRVPPPQTRLAAPTGGTTYYQPAAPQTVIPGGAQAATPVTTFAAAPAPSFNGPEPQISVPTDQLDLRLGSSPPPQQFAITTPQVQQASQYQQPQAAQPWSNPALPAVAAAASPQPATSYVNVPSTSPSPALASTAVSRPMSVTLSPTPQPDGNGLAWVSGSAPRTPLPTFNADPAVQQASYSTAAPRVRLPSNGGYGTPRVTELPARGAVQQVAPPMIGDGFVPRGASQPSF